MLTWAAIIFAGLLFAAMIPPLLGRVSWAAGAGPCEHLHSISRAQRLGKQAGAGQWGGGSCPFNLFLHDWNLGSPPLSSQGGTKPCSRTISANVAPPSVIPEPRVISTPRHSRSAGRAGHCIDFKTRASLRALCFPRRPYVLGRLGAVIAVFNGTSGQSLVVHSESRSGFSAFLAPFCRKLGLYGIVGRRLESWAWPLEIWSAILLLRLCAKGPAGCRPWPWSSCGLHVSWVFVAHTDLLRSSLACNP